MDTLQHLFVYITLAVAIGYILKKFFLPTSWFSKKKQESKACGQNNCGCK